ncbi:MAG: lysostaphin resistance A-like protein [Bacteroidales bacterium]
MKRFTDFAFTGKCKNTLLYFAVFVGIFMVLMQIFCILIALTINRLSTDNIPLSISNLAQIIFKNGIIASIIAFVPTFLATYFIIPKIHKRKFLSFNTIRRKFSFKRYFIAMLVATVVYSTSFCIEYFFTDSDYVYNFEPASFYRAIPIALLMLPIQSYIEEFFFRSYLLQGIALGTKSILASVLLSATTFAILHSLNPEVLKYGAVNVIGSIFIIGLAYTIITVLDGGIELSSGLHAFNNISASLFVGMETNVLGAKPLFTTNTINENLMLPGTILQTGILFFILYLIFRWKNFSNLRYRYSSE